jgi:hypothetical protein
MSDTNRVGLRILEETLGSPGTRAVGAYDAVPFTGSSDLGFTPETTVSNIIRSDRQVSDLVLVNGTVGGSFDTELVKGDALNSLVSGALFAENGSALADQSVTALTASGTATAALSSGGVSVTATGLGTNAVVGNMAIIRNVTSPSTLVAGVITAKTTDTVTVSQKSNPFGAATFTPSAQMIPTVTNSTQERSFSMERAFRTGEGAAEFFEYLDGMRVNSMSINASASSIVTSSFSFLGQNQEFATARDTASVTSTPAVPSYSVYNAASNVGALTLNDEGTISTIGADNFIMEASIEINNNLRERNALGTLGAISIGAGEFSVTGSLNTYFSDSSLLDELLNNGEMALNLVFDTGTLTGAKQFMVYMPRIKFTEGTPDVSGKNADVMANLSFQALASTGADPYTIKIGVN